MTCTRAPQRVSTKNMPLSSIVHQLSVPRVLTTVYVLFVRVAGATCVCVCFWARRVARRHRTCAVAVRPALSLRETTRSVLRFLTPFGCRPTGFPRHCSPPAVVTFVQTDTLSCCRDTVLRRTLCQRFGGRCGQSRASHLCVMPTILSHLCVNE